MRFVGGLESLNSRPEPSDQSIKYHRLIGLIAMEVSARMMKATRFTSNDVTTLGDKWASVKSQSDPEKTYTVDLSGEPSCTCPDHVYRGTTCKHMYKAADELGVLTLPTEEGN